MQTLANIIDLETHPINQSAFRQRCKQALDEHGVLVLKDFLQAHAIEQIKQEGEANQALAYFCSQNHNVYLTPAVSEFDMQHPRNREVVSSKGCITDDQIPLDSPLHTLYDSTELQSFFCYVLGEKALYEYADPLSSINLHYANNGKELGWHFDNSSFAITLLIQKPELGGEFEYIKDVRDADSGEMNYETVEQVLDGKLDVTTLSMDAGSLVLFRGRNSIHRVAPVQGDTTRMLVVLAYNSEPNIALSESARMTFYGRLE